MTSTTINTMANPAIIADPMSLAASTPDDSNIFAIVKRTAKPKMTLTASPAIFPKDDIFAPNSGILYSYCGAKATRLSTMKHKIELVA